MKCETKANGEKRSKMYWRIRKKNKNREKKKIEREWILKQLPVRIKQNIRKKTTTTTTTKNRLEAISINSW